MRPKSKLVVIIGILGLLLGVTLVAVGIGLTEWSDTNLSEQPTVVEGLFRQCDDLHGCREKDNKSDSLLLVTGLAIAGAISGMLAFLLALVMSIYVYIRPVNACSGIMAWVTLMWSFVAAGAIAASLAVYEDREFSDGPSDRLGLSYVLTGTGGGFILLSGALFFAGALKVIAYREQQEKDILLHTTHPSSINMKSGKW